MLKMRFAILSSLCLLTCDPGFKTMTGVDGDSGSGGTTTINLDLMKGTSPAIQGIGLTNNIQLTCTPTLGIGSAVRATSTEVCTGGAGSSLVKCSYAISDSVLSQSAVTSGQVFNLTYAEKKLLPFHGEVSGSDFDLIQSWAAIVITYTDNTTQTFLSAETNQSMNKASQITTQRFRLNQSISKVANVTFAAFLSCTGAKVEKLSSLCGVTCNRIDRRLADSNGLLSLAGTFSWEVSNLKLEIN